jgi:hypothetical protein
MPDKPSTSGIPNRFRNWLSLIGLILAIGGFFAFALLFLIDIFAHDGNPYMGLLAYVIAPGFMILGMVTIGVGAWLHRKHLRAAPEKAPAITIDLNRARDRRVLVGVTVGAALFLMLTAFGSWRRRLCQSEAERGASVDRSRDGKL